MRIHLAIWGSVLGLALVGAGCVYDLTVEGKECDNATHFCPEGFTCSPGGTGGAYICKAHVPDGGEPDGDGGTDQTGPCTEGKKRCPADITKIETCEEGSWIPSDCGTEPPTYCFETPALEAVCLGECAASGECPTGYYCEPDNHHCQVQGNCSPPGTYRCNVSITNQLDICDPQSLNWELYQACTAGTQYCDFNDNSCKNFCYDDTDCQDYAGTSCDQIDWKCYPMGLCTLDADCSGGQKCWGGACLVLPTTPADNGINPAGSTPANLDCFSTPAPPPATPTSCALEGNVTGIVLTTPSSLTVGLTIRVHTRVDILDGILDNPIDSVLATSVSGNGFYHFDAVPTNQELVLEVQGGPGTGKTFKTMFTFGIYLRADDCAAASNVLTQDVPALEEGLYSSYIIGGDLQITPQDNRGLLFGVLKNCGGNFIRFATAGLSLGLENSRLYYFRHVPVGCANPDPCTPYEPRSAETDTNERGYVAASNVKPIRGVISAVAMKDDNPLDLRLVGSQPVRVFAQKASFVLFGAWKNPTP